MFPAFDDETKAIRKAAIAELRTISDQRDMDHSRPLFPMRTRGAELATHNEFDRRDLLAQKTLTDTARSYMDSFAVCEWREMVREQIRMTRLYQNDRDEERREKMAGYYRERVGRWVQGYRRAIAHARPAAPLKQAAE